MVLTVVTFISSSEEVVSHHEILTIKIEHLTIVLLRYVKFCFQDSQVLRKTVLDTHDSYTRRRTKGE